MQQTSELSNDEDNGMSEADFARAQKKIDYEAQHYPVEQALQARKERVKGLTYYIMFAKADKKSATEVRDEVIDFINKEYSRVVSVKAAADPGRTEGVKIIFNNEAEEQKNLLLKILAEKDWHITGEIHPVERTYEPAPLTEPLVPIPEPRPTLGVVKPIRPKLQPKPAESEPQEWQKRPAA